MLKLKTKNLITGEELEANEISDLIQWAGEFKKQRKKGELSHVLAGKSLALVFDKPSLRTRFSFTIAMSELGGASLESVLSNRKQELPQDIGRVLSGYCHGIVVRAHEEAFIEAMANGSWVPVINGLSEKHHPCQILADLMTLGEVFGSLKGLTLSYIGDGNNILHSWLLLAPLVGVQIHYACPEKYQPDPDILKRAQLRAQESGARIQSFSSPREAVMGAHAVYTDVWTSMGFEENQKQRDLAFAGYQVNDLLMTYALEQAVVMHCLPMQRGQEISWGLPERANSVIFRQSENRLHLQKALLVGLLKTG